YYTDWLRLSERMSTAAVYSHPANMSPADGVTHLHLRNVCTARGSDAVHRPSAEPRGNGAQAHCASTTDALPDRPPSTRRRWQSCQPRPPARYRAIFPAFRGPAPAAATAPP